MQFSARNVLKGKVQKLVNGPVNTEVTVRLPSALLNTSAVWLLGAKPPKIVHWQLSTIISEPSLP